MSIIDDVRDLLTIATELSDIAANAGLSDDGLAIVDGFLDQGDPHLAIDMIVRFAVGAGLQLPKDRLLEVQNAYSSTSRTDEETAETLTALSRLLPNAA